MSEFTGKTVEPMRIAETTQISKIRRFTPQIIVALIKNLIILNKSCFDGFSTIVIPALTGIANNRNPNETIRLTPAQSSWLSTCTYIGHPFGSLLSGFISDALGRRRALMLVVAPAVFAFIMLGLAESFEIVLLAFFLLSFIFGLKDAPSVIYVSEVSEPSIRGILLSLTPFAGSLGHFTVYLLGSFLPWRQVSLAASILPVIIVTAIFFMWLRGWVQADAVHDEFTRLKNHISLGQKTCEQCEQSDQCPHVKVTFSDKCRELCQKRTLKPFILANSLNIFQEFCLLTVMKPYMIQILKALGVPLDAHYTATILSSINIGATFCFLICVKLFGKRRLYLCSTIVAVLCCFGLSIYGFVFFPPNWTSFKNASDPTIPNFEYIQRVVGNYGYLAVALLFIMEFSSQLGIATVPTIMQCEIFSLKLRSFLCGLTQAIKYLLASVSTKTYYNIEIWLTLPGAILFYGMISLIGLAAMFFILPETEQRSLEDIELHYADNTKKITDIHITINKK